MARVSGMAALLIGIAVAGAAEPPVVAPKPRVTLRSPACENCRFLAVPRPKGRILPVQDGPFFESAPLTPQPLPLPQDATPLPAAEANSTLEGLLDRFLPEATAEERGAWAEELRGLPPELARDILAARSRSAEPQVLAEPPADSDEAGPPPQAGQAAIPAPLRTARRGTEHADRSRATLGALAEAESILLHNIANADTVGFKRVRPVFAEAAASGGLAGVSGQRVATQGAIEETGRPFDLALDGAGFFQVRRGDTVALTRRGIFALNAAGELVTEISGEEWSLNPPIRIPAEGTEVTVDRNGAVGCRLANEEGLTQVGLIELVRVSDPSRLEPAGGGLLAVPEVAGAATSALPGSTGLATVRQGSLERSNVDLAAELKALNRLRKQITALGPISRPQLASPREGEHQ